MFDEWTKTVKVFLLISWYLVNLLLIYDEEMVRWGSGEKPQTYRLRYKLEKKTGQSFVKSASFWELVLVAQGLMTRKLPKILDLHTVSDKCQKSPQTGGSHMSCRLQQSQQEPTQDWRHCKLLLQISTKFQPRLVRNHILVSFFLREKL